MYYNFIITIIQDILNNKTIDTNYKDNLMYLGFDALSTFRLLNKINKKYNIKMNDLINDFTIDGINNLIIESAISKIINYDTIKSDISENRIMDI